MERIQRPKWHREPGKPASGSIVVPTLDRDTRVQAGLEVIDELQSCGLASIADMSFMRTFLARAEQNSTSIRSLTVGRESERRVRSAT